ncbi:helix-turn-helix domain-containing protein [Cohnella mopanensis]|uniref:helix-turn-helix domain-containing protein n=1 Tax=Cohnella mopanensis TaxID=2911966 RepID=UPI001EF98DAB|nr:helix-turn-helix domain-containing protein [Cohnella mopanensis]
MQLENRMAQQKLFVRLMIPYFLFMLLALILGWLIYSQTYRLVKDEVTRNNMQLLEQVKDTMDSRFSEISRISTELSSNPMVQSFQRVHDPFNSTTTIKVIETQKNLYSYNASNNFVLNYFVVFKNSDLALSTNSTYELPAFYRHVLSYNNMDYNAWRSDLFSTYRNQELMMAGMTNYEGKSRGMLTYVQSLGYPNRIQGALIFLVDEQKLRNLLSGIDVSDGGWAYIVDNKGRLVSSLSDDGAVPDVNIGQYPANSGIIEAGASTNDMMVTYTTSSYNGWTYVVAQPPHVVLSKVLSIKQTTVTILLLFLVLGIVMAYLFATRNGKPLVKITSTLKNRLSGGESKRLKDMYGYIQSSLDVLIDNNDALQDAIDRQAPILWESFMGRLLKGDFLSLNEINSLLKHQRAEINGTGYAVGILHFHSGDHGFNADVLHKLDIERVLINEVLRGTIADDQFIHNIAEDKIAMLFVDYSDDNDLFRQMIQSNLVNISSRIHDHMQIKLHFAVGGFRTSLLEVTGSYEEARQSLSTIHYEEEGQTVWFSELSNTNAGFYFPGDVENRLINYTKAGEVEEVQMLLQLLYRENFQQRHLPLAMQQLFFFEIISCLVKIQDQLLLQNQDDVKLLMQQLSATEDTKRTYNKAVEKFVSICAEIDKRKKSRNVKLFEDIVTYLQDNYGQASMSLEAVADHMHISKGYLSQFFKEQMGVNLSDYLENLRMDKAKNLLASTSLPIGEIAEKVGYQSASTFSRAFKRGSGVSATSYRESAYKEESLTS